MRCGKCGTENSERNRFCGMCGAPLLAKAPAASNASPIKAPLTNAPSTNAPLSSGSLPSESGEARRAATPVNSAVLRQSVAPVRPASGLVPNAVSNAISNPASDAALNSASDAGRMRSSQADRSEVRSAPAAPSYAAPAYAAPSYAAPAPAAPAETRRRMEPMITGPSFLGLGAPSGAEYRSEDGRDEDGRDDGYSRSPASFRHDSHSSGDVNYLLEDEEEPKRGWGKLLLVIVALALALGFGYLRWRQGGFDWLNGGAKKAETAPAGDASANGGDSGAAPAQVSPNGTGAPGGTAATGTESGPGNGAASSQSAPRADASPGTAPGNGAGKERASQGASQSGGDQSGASQADAAQGGAARSASPEPAAASPEAEADNAVAKKTSPESETANPDAGPPDNDAETESEKPAAAAAARPAATLRKPPAAKPLDAVNEAERYIYGRGVAQDCDRGVRLLKGEQTNTRAMSMLGTLYSSGTCTPRDLPTAYRWYALALHKEPDNQALQEDLQKLWAQMTQPERQLAIKLSQ